MATGPQTIGDVVYAIDGHVGSVVLRRPPHNYFDAESVACLATAFRRLDEDPRCRAIVLRSDGRSFCAGADFGSDGGGLDGEAAARIYEGAIALFSVGKPIVAAIQGPAIGGGLGLALVADFRIASTQGCFAANFARLGIHSGFGISAMLPAVVGRQAALLMLETGRRIDAAEAARIGLTDRVVPAGRLVAEAQALAAEIAAAAPLAVQSMRRTLLGDRAEQVRRAVAIEIAAQRAQFASEDFREGILAAHERRMPVFRGR
jgi:enoyl-CoA hydratase/carnithine racemase